MSPKEDIISVTQVGQHHGELNKPDVDELFEIYFNETFPADRDNLERKETYRRNIDRLLQDPRTVLVFDREKLVGWGSADVFRPKENTLMAELRAVTVHPDYQGMGLSKRIRDTLEGDLRWEASSRGLRKLCVLMSSHNPRILDSAVKQGYTRVSMEDWYKRIGYEPKTEDERAHFQWLKSTGMEIVFKEEDLPESVREDPGLVTRLIAEFRRRVGV